MKTDSIAALVDVLKDVLACLDVSADLDIDVGVIFDRQIGTVGHHSAVLLEVILWGRSRPTPTVFEIFEVWFEDGVVAEVL